MGLPSSSGSDNAAAQARADENARQARINSGMATINQDFAGFNDPFYAGISKAYTNYAEPQVDQQYKNAHDNLTFGLARGGLLKSSVANQKFADLDQDYNNQRLGVADQAKTQANQQRAQVENSRSNLVNQLQATADPSAAASAAVGQAKILNTANAFSPIGTLFQNATAGLANAAGGPYNGYNGILGGSLFNNGTYAGATPRASTVVY